MAQDDRLQRLKAQHGKLAAFNVRSLSVFGSVARGEAGPDSDIDILVEFNGPATFDQYMKLKLFLEDVLGTPVDLLTRKGIRPELAPYVEREAVHVA
jgi:predicted nucleotidyltransferase